MFSFIVISAAYWLYCIAWFTIVQKPLFALYNRHSSTAPVTAADTTAVYRHGLVSDIIVASYLTAVPLIAGAVCTAIPGRDDLEVTLTVYNAIIATAVGLLVTADTALYRFWKFKIDSSVFAYLRSIKGATASVSGSYIISFIFVWGILGGVFFAGAQLVCGLCMRHLSMPLTWMSWWSYPTVLIAMSVGAGLLFMAIRGLKIRPNNPSVVYFSSNAFFNHWALNPGYNMVYSLSTKDEFKGRFQSFDTEECSDMIKAMFPTGGTPQRKLLRTDRPDIMLIVWESFGAEFSKAFGGRKGVTPCVDALAEESVKFTNCTAGSFRTDRGLVCLLSGYPAQPTTSIIRYTRKLPNMPGLARTLKDHGYTTIALHGGDMSIMHKNDYYLACGHDRLISQVDMPSSAPSCKWGVHDGYMMERAADEAIKLAAEHRPYLITLQTLSSHEPFDVPYDRLTDQADNSFAYTDHSLGQMINRLKKSPTWDNLLVIVVADHGFNAAMLPPDRKSYAHIPLMFTGGAISGPARIDTLMSQTDLAATLLGQMGIDHSDFIFSRDVLADTYTDPFALHIFNNGFMITDPRGTTIYDTMIEKATEGDDERRMRMGKAILQKIYEDLDQR